MSNDTNVNPAALKKALAALRQRDRFEVEIRNMLLKAQFDDEITENVVRYLKERCFINDRRTITNEIERRSGRRAIGRNKIRAELIARGAPESEIDELLESGSSEDERDEATALLKTKYVPTDDRRKGGRYLQGRGYSEDVIEYALDRFFGSVDDDG